MSTPRVASHITTQLEKAKNVFEKKFRFTDDEESEQTVWRVEYTRILKKFIWNNGELLDKGVYERSQADKEKRNKVKKLTRLLTKIASIPIIFNFSVRILFLKKNKAYLTVSLNFDVRQSRKRLYRKSFSDIGCKCSHCSVSVLPRWWELVIVCREKDAKEVQEEEEE